MQSISNNIGAMIALLLAGALIGGTGVLVGVTFCSRPDLAVPRPDFAVPRVANFEKIVAQAIDIVDSYGVVICTLGPDTYTGEGGQLRVMTAKGGLVASISPVLGGGSFFLSRPLKGQEHIIVKSINMHCADDGGIISMGGGRQDTLEIGAGVDTTALITLRTVDEYTGKVLSTRVIEPK